MADYQLKDGRGTKVREDSGALEGYVDFDTAALSEETAPAATDKIILQRGTSIPKYLQLSILSSLQGYDTIWIPAGAMTPSTTAGAEASTAEYASYGSNHDVMLFAGDTADESAEFNLTFPPSWDLGNIRYKVFWKPASSDTAADEWVRFYLASRAFKDNDLDDVELGSPVYRSDQVISDTRLHVTATSVDVTVTSIAAQDSMIHFKLSRDYDYEGGGGTAMDIDAMVFGMLIQYKKTLAGALWS